MPTVHKPLISVVALTSLLVMPACRIGGCPAVYAPPSLEIEPSSILTAPGQLKLRSDGVLGNQCDTFTATEVAFYMDGVRLGVDRQAPFELTWNLVPGQGGVPASGSKDVLFHAVTNIPGLVETRQIPARITVTTP